MEVIIWRWRSVFLGGGELAGKGKKGGLREGVEFDVVVFEAMWTFYEAGNGFGKG
jgi:hypothetical protein